MEEIELNRTSGQKVRGVDLEDKRFFSEKEIERLRYAQEEICFLMDRNYPIKPVIKLVGDRYQFSARQRLALQRATGKSESCQLRKAKCLPLEDMADGCVYIDGFNLMITLETALSGGTLLLGQDGMLRDLAGIRGNYRLIEQTDKALEIIGTVLRTFQAKEVCFYLDAPVSNSGRLKTRIIEQSKDWGMTVEVQVVHNPDSLLMNSERVISTDAVILDACRSFFNFGAYCVQKYITDAVIADLS